MYVALKVIALMVKELLRIYTEENTLENLKMVNDTDRELLLGQTKENTLENGKMINDTDRELLSMLMEELIMLSRKTVKQLNI